MHSLRPNNQIRRNLTVLSCKTYNCKVPICFLKSDGKFQHLPAHCTAGGGGEMKTWFSMVVGGDNTYQCSTKLLLTGHALIVLDQAWKVLAYTCQMSVGAGVPYNREKTENLVCNPPTAIHPHPFHNSKQLLGKKCVIQLGRVLGGWGGLGR